MIDPHPTPMIEVRDVYTDADFGASLVRRLGQLTVPSLLASQGIGLDGAVSGIETQNGQVHVDWWCDGPSDWRAFTAEVERLRLDLDGLN